MQTLTKSIEQTIDVITSEKGLNFFVLRRCNRGISLISSCENFKTKLSSGFVSFLFFNILLLNAIRILFRNYFRSFSQFLPQFFPEFLILD